MKTFYLLSSGSLRFWVIIGLFSLMATALQAQIYEPEGLNMPGAWNNWVNPPANNLVFASATQVTGGKLTKIAGAVPRWTTTISVKATGGDVIGGSYKWIFTSGPATNYYQNKWASVNVIIDSLQLYTKEGAADDSIALENDRWYIMNWEDQGYANTHAIFMRTSAVPVDILTVSTPASVAPNSAATVNLTLSAAKCPEEKVYVRYSTDAWATSSVLTATMTGTSGTVSIPGQTAGTVVSYYAFTSTKSAITGNYNLYTIRSNNNSGTNYSYTVTGGTVSIDFANLQFPATGYINIGGNFNVYGRAEIPGITGQATVAPGLEAWVGISSTNTDPATWTQWITATFQGPITTYDEFVGNIGPSILTNGTKYYATRFRYNNGNYVYGGYSSTGGGYWDGTNNVSGILDVFVGVNNLTSDGVKIYPNPATDVVSLEFTGNSTVRLFDVLGKVILEREFSAGVHQFDLTMLKTGIYHLQIREYDRMFNSTIIKK